ncbi:MAG TPA: hypothetical protein EYN67_12370 [Flavobacteriales bacterium]|nr:hypothetical protein [Methylococcaceae bacterium]HHZ96317.1 hypothetical protein [Flavobacteriales bacterium]HIO13103.1 hypothetical protein [Methylococcales bacterium]
MYTDNKMEIEKQFKKDIGFSIAEAEIKLRKIKRDNNELYNLRCSLNGFCSEANEKIVLSDDVRVIVKARIIELEH